MTQIIKRENIYKFTISLLVPLIIIILKPINLEMRQGVILGSIFLTVIWWGTGIVHKDAASIFLLIIFVLLGDTSLEKIFYFPVSDTFVLVVSSFLISQGIINSKVADKFSYIILNKYCYNSVRLVIMSFLLNILMIFVIPHPFPRIILLASIYNNYLKQEKIAQQESSVLIFSIFVASTITSMMFINGDVVINNSALQLGEITMDYVQWARNMALPTLITAGIIMCSFLLIFKKDMAITFNKNNTIVKLNLEHKEKITILITIILISLWVTEGLHGVKTATVAMLGVSSMFLTRIINFQDLKYVNVSVLISLTAQFAIGKVLVGSGITMNLNQFLIEMFPSHGSIMYLPSIIILTMFLHMMMGSSVTAISVIIPSMLALTNGIYTSEFIVLLVTISVCMHYLLPFHHVSIMIGNSNQYYSSKLTFKMGIVLTGLTLVSVLFIFVPWWKIMNL
ncbi:MAG: SLC13 family permease [Eubacteriales bacterium]